MRALGGAFERGGERRRDGLAKRLGADEAGRQGEDKGEAQQHRTRGRLSGARSAVNDKRKRNPQSSVSAPPTHRRAALSPPMRLLPPAAVVAAALAAVCALADSEAAQLDAEGNPIVGYLYNSKCVLLSFLYARADARARALTRRESLQLPKQVPKRTPCS